MISALRVLICGLYIICGLYLINVLFEIMIFAITIVGSIVHKSICVWVVSLTLSKQCIQ